MPTEKRPVPTTCKEAAARFTQWGDEGSSWEGARCHEIADLLLAFGDAPLPEAIKKRYRFEDV